MDASERAYHRVQARTVSGPTVQPELGPCLDCTYHHNGLGYHQVRIAGRGTVLAHRICLEHSLGRRLGDGMRALHRCDRRGCVRETHLYEGTQKQNVRDRVERNIESFPRGEQHGATYLQEHQVRQIRQYHREGWGNRRIAEHCALPKTTVYNIVIRRTWKYVLD